MNRLSIAVLALVASAVCGLSSCRSDEVPPYVMGMERMASFLQEAYIIEGFYAVESGFHYDTLQPEMIGAYDSLLSRYGMDREGFERSVDWYVSHPKVYREVHDTVLARLEREAAQ